MKHITGEFLPLCIPLVSSEMLISTKNTINKWINKKGKRVIHKKDKSCLSVALAVTTLSPTMSVFHHLADRVRRFIWSKISKWLDLEIAEYHLFSVHCVSVFGKRGSEWRKPGSELWMRQLVSRSFQFYFDLWRMRRQKQRFLVIIM